MTNFLVLLLLHKNPLLTDNRLCVFQIRLYCIVSGALFVFFWLLLIWLGLVKSAREVFSSVLFLS